MVNVQDRYPETEYEECSLLESTRGIDLRSDWGQPEQSGADEVDNGIVAPVYAELARTDPGLSNYVTRLVDKYLRYVYKHARYCEKL